MVIKVYISGISASQEVKKRQQRALLILDSVPVDYESVDITEPGREEERQWLRDTCKERTNPLPPQFFNDEIYCGDYEDFNSAVDIDQVLAFLKLESIEKADEHVPTGLLQNGKTGQNGRIEDEPEVPSEEVEVTELTREEVEPEEIETNDDREEGATIEKEEEELKEEEEELEEEEEELKEEEEDENEED